MNSENKIYLDNAASTPVSSFHLDFYRDCMERYYCNQEAAHDWARKAREEIDLAGKRILKAVTGAEAGNVLWSNCGSDALDTVISMPAFSGRRIISTCAEHSCIEAALRRRTDCELCFTGIKPDGRIDLKQFETFLDSKTALVVLHHVQSETGAIQNLQEIRTLIAKHAPEAKLLIDSIQAIGKLPFAYNEIKPDFMVVSGRKIGAPGGGVLIYKDSEFDYYFKKLRHAEHQLCRVEPAICLTLAKCITDLYSNSVSHHSAVAILNKKLRNALSELIVKERKVIQFTLPEKLASPYIIHFTAHPFQGAILLRMLAQSDIMAAAGSACDAETKNPSKVLLAMGMKKERAFSALRLSLWDNNTEKDCDIFIEKFTKILNEY